MTITGRAWLAHHVGVLPDSLSLNELIGELNRRFRRPVPADSVLLFWKEDPNGHLVPDADGTRDFGTLLIRPRELFAKNAITVDGAGGSTVRLRMVISGTTGLFGCHSNHNFRLMVNNTAVWVIDTNFDFLPDIDDRDNIGSTSKRVKEVHTGTVRLNASNMGIFRGSGSPESAVTADVGSTFHRSDGGAGTSFYVKESGTGNTGWVAK